MFVHNTIYDTQYQFNVVTKKKEEKTCNIVWITLYSVLAQEGLVAKTPLGDVLGYHKQSFQNRTYLAFEGIPFAKPPIDDLRFRVS